MNNLKFKYADNFNCFGSIFSFGQNDKKDMLDLLRNL